MLGAHTYMKANIEESIEKILLLKAGEAVSATCVLNCPVEDLRSYLTVYKILCLESSKCIYHHYLDQ